MIEIHVGYIIAALCLTLALCLLIIRVTIDRRRARILLREADKTARRGSSKPEEQLRAYISKLTEPKRNGAILWPDQMARTFLAFNDTEKAAFFDRLTVRVRAENGAMMRRQRWEGMIGKMSFDSLFLVQRVLGPMMDKELRRLWDVRPRSVRTDDLQ